MESLNPAKVTKVRKDLVEVDYLRKLNNEDKRWLAQFTDEYTAGSVQKDKRGKVKSGYLHNTKALAKDCYDSNNRRNNDVHGVTRANGLLYDIDQVSNNKDGWYITQVGLTEDALIKKVDQFESSKNDVLSFEEYEKLKNNLTKRTKEYYELLYADKLKKK